MASTFEDILELAVAIEVECAAVYEVLGRRFSADSDLAMFWRLYAESERYHAATLRIHQATFGVTHSDDAAYPVEAEASRVFLEQLRAWRRDFEGGAPTRSFAFSVALTIENSTAELHGRTQFFKENPRFAELFARLAEEDISHRQMLADAEKRFGI